MKIGIIGFSRFGQLLAKILKPHAEVLVYNRSDKSNETKELGVTWAKLEQVCQCDWVIVSVAISATEDMIKQIAPLLKKGSLVMDVCSVKVFPSQWLEKYISKDNEIMATHPMFGPDSAANGLKDLQWVICPLRISPDKLAEVKKVLNGLEVKIIETTPQEHDKETAISLALVHFIGRGLEEFGIKPQRISTLGFERLLKVNETVTNDSFRLFLDMQKYNPYAKEARERFINSVQTVNKKVTESEKGGQ
ncbi:MAG: prephenate dehydrogenase/arogenate dehydrogenase family protein [Candidatus Parcubacteria bacterium]|nr:prephenate dehydrogenase/arogenate dehydrogenase family protein [Candidatus Parcubacteria bacterium]